MFMDFREAIQARYKGSTADLADKELIVVRLPIPKCQRLYGELPSKHACPSVVSLPLYIGSGTKKIPGSPSPSIQAAGVGPSEDMIFIFWLGQ